MSEMIVNVARAIFDSRHKPLERVTLYGNQNITFDEVLSGIAVGIFVESSLDGEFKEARAAMEAMREPTEEMLDALNIRHRREVQRREVGKDYTTMIDTALKEDG